MTTKEEQVVDSFESYLTNNDTQAIIDNLPRLLKGYLKNAKRMDKILKQGDNQQLQVLKLTESLEETNYKVNTLLNNAGQGFLYFDKEMKIGAEYSKEAYRIFGKDLIDQNITTFLYEDESDRLFLTSTLQSILTDTAMRQEILISLLQEEFYINNRFITVKYKVLNESNFMMILTDITEKKNLDKQIKNEQQILKMVVEVVTTLEQFVEIKNNYVNLIVMINNYKSLDSLAELTMQIHTFKGLFAQKEMLNIVQYLHKFEDEITLSIKHKKLTTVLENITFNEMNAWIEEDIKILKDILGDDFFSKENYVSIDRNRIGKLYAKVQLYMEKQTIYCDDEQSILDDIEELKYQNVKILFRPYEKLIEQLSFRLGKEMNPLILSGDDIYISNVYKSFINSLVHIFRNSLDHGIESAERRLEYKKDIKGTIKCNITKDDNITLIIEDDGSGIDSKRIKAKALEKEIFTKEQLDKMDEKQLIALIFEDDFSTSEDITDISGRGVGMASVMYELNKLNGTIQIDNNLGYGLKFTFVLPIHNQSDNDIDLVEKLSYRTISYFEEMFNISIDGNFDINSTEIVESPVAIIIPLTNDMDGSVYMGVSKELAKELIRDYLSDDMSQEEILELSCENISELLNITLGNILKDLNIMKNGGIVGISIPKILKTNTAITKENNSKIIESKLFYKNEEIVLSYFI